MNIGNMSMKETNKCPVCNASEVEEYEICEVCGWENDSIQLIHRDLQGGANIMSLAEAQKAYKRGEKVK